MQDSYFFAKSLSNNGFASITSMQIIKRSSQFGFKPFYEIQAHSKEISWDPKQTLMHKGIYHATKTSYVIAPKNVGYICVHLYIKINVNKKH